MVEHLFVLTDVVLLSIAIVASYYSIRARSLFKGDVMGRFFFCVALAFVVMALFSVLDAIAEIAYVDVGFLVLRIGGTIASGLAVVALVTLIRWAGPSKESKSAL